MVPSPSWPPSRCARSGSIRIRLERSTYSVYHSTYSRASLFLVTTAADARDTRDRILDATIRLLRRQGYTATGIKQIVSEGDAPLGSVYHYFPGGKEQIGIEALARSGERIRSTIARAGDAPDLPAAINNYFVVQRRAPPRLRLPARVSHRHRRARDRQRHRAHPPGVLRGRVRELAGHADQGVRRRRHRRVRRRSARHVRAVELRGRAHHESAHCATSSPCSRAAPRWRRCCTRTWATPPAERG